MGGVVQVERSIREPNDPPASLGAPRPREQLRVAGRVREPDGLREWGQQVLPHWLRLGPSFRQGLLRDGLRFSHRTDLGTTGAQLHQHGPGLGSLSDDAPPAVRPGQRGRSFEVGEPRSPGRRSSRARLRGSAGRDDEQQSDACSETHGVLSITRQSRLRVSVPLRAQRFRAFSIALATASWGAMPCQAPSTRPSRSIRTVVGRARMGPKTLFPSRMRSSASSTG